MLNTHPLRCFNVYTYQTAGFPIILYPVTEVVEAALFGLLSREGEGRRLQLGEASSAEGAGRRGSASGISTNFGGARLAPYTEAYTEVANVGRVVEEDAGKDSCASHDQASSFSSSSSSGGGSLDGGSFSSSSRNAVVTRGESESGLCWCTRDALIRVAVRIGEVSVCCIIAVAVPNFGLFSNVVGAFLVTIVGFIIPPLMHVASLRLLRGEGGAGDNANAAVSTSTPCDALDAVESSVDSEVGAGAGASASAGAAGGSQGLEGSRGCVPWLRPRSTGDVLLLLLDAVLFVFGVVQCAQGTFYSLADVAAAL